MTQVATQALRSVHTIDPKKEIWDALKGWLEDVDPTGQDVIVCVYERPEKITAPGGTEFIVPATASRRAEDKFQGIVGLVVKLGPNVGKCGPALGRVPVIGEWIAFRNQDANQFVLGGRSMRFLEAQFIRLWVKRPDAVV